ncbi:DUF1128 domain-containing protein [Chungangia koreensis]|uniref:DUF1128 domain-containing protein n=1 Tax=Chungangia koreensis TaxID=752657 RepID=A0ABV8X2M6_9LACT
MINPNKVKGVLTLDLSNPTPANIDYMVSQIKEKLRMVNVDAVKSEHFSQEQYEDLRDIYDMVIKRDTFSPSEMQAIAAELGSLRK